ncbi:mannitol dehydrogenase family protein [Kiloniella majae]|uniref:mannitol dehydrogenase family protein n=1 Tax=Kiloniella majae TaxID=1938558 RepID=UPI000A2774C7|nr:mannitol dehydrogenase family protein [Kiloniella majae]
MNAFPSQSLYETTYNPKFCDVGIVHLGFGAFHRSHQAQYIDDYMQATDDLRWGIAAINIRSEDSESFAKYSFDGSGYILKSISPAGDVKFRRVRSHIKFCDWARSVEEAEQLLTQPSVTMITITVTESGYYLNDEGHLNRTDTVIAGEIENQSRGSSVYNYLMHALERRRYADVGGLSILCCDNIRQNGKVLERNFLSYLHFMDRLDLARWVQKNVTFPCSMVDRITPRSTESLLSETISLFGEQSHMPVMAEEFTQWALEDHFANRVPDLARVGVQLEPDIDHFEETKIRILNGGHTCIAYFAALKGLKTFDQAMADPEIFAHFDNYEHHEVLPALKINTPFDKNEYLQDIIARFKNASISDTIERICADGFLKFPIFIHPTLHGAFAANRLPRFGIGSIASWYIFCRLNAEGKLGTHYNEPNWHKLEPLIKPGAIDDFVTSRLLWGDIPKDHPEFKVTLKNKIHEMERAWLA